MSKPEAQKRLRLNKAYRRLLAWVRGANIDPRAVARAIVCVLSTTRYCLVIGLPGKVAEVVTCSIIEEEKSAFKRSDTNVSLFNRKEKAAYT